MSKSGATERKFRYFTRGIQHTPVPERSPFYWPGMKQRWRRCDFWGNVVLWFPSRNFILALHPYRALSPPLLAAPPTSNIHLYFSRIIVTAMSRASERERERRIIRRERSSDEDGRIKRRSKKITNNTVSIRNIGERKEE